MAGRAFLLVWIAASGLLPQTAFAFPNTMEKSTLKPRRSARIAKNSLMRRSSSLAEQDMPKSVWRSHKTTTTVLHAATNESSPQFTFGVIADIQYAPIPDGFSYSGTPRYYRHSLEAAKHAAQHFERDGVSLVLNFGDIIDGKCQSIENHGGDKVVGDPGLEAVDEVLSHLNTYTQGPILHTYGNHELYNLDRSVLGEKLGIPFIREPCGDLVGYRSHVHKNVRFVVLDTYDINVLRRCPETSRKHKSAVQLLQKNNPNYPDLENSPEGMNGVKRRYVAFNGGIDQPQLAWLRDTLQEARQANQKVVILSHQPILPGSSSPVCLVWNYNDVLKILREYSDIVVASLAGHAHMGGYKRCPKSGIHFRVVEAALQSPSPIKTYGMVDVYSDKLVLRGFGDCESAVYDFDHTVSYVEDPQDESKNMTKEVVTC